MRVLLYCLRGVGGGVANMHLMLAALAREYPDDQYGLVVRYEDFEEVLERYPNVMVVPGPNWPSVEAARLFMGLGGLRRWAGRFEADLLWAINIGPYLPVRVPYVLGLHNAYQVYPWEVAKFHPSSKARVALMRWFFRRSLARSDGVIAQTRLMADYVRRTAGAPKLIRVIPKAIETEDDVAAEPLPAELRRLVDRGTDKEPFTFLYVGTGMPHKNHGLLVRVFDGLFHAGVNARLVLTVSEAELVSLAGTAARNSVEKGRVVCTGWVAKRHLRNLYACVDACLMPSLLESLSSAHLEAMAWRRPLISADLPFARDLCGDAALYADPASEPDWVARIGQLMADGDLRDRLCVAGLERMRAFPRSWSQVAAQVRQLFVDVIEAKRRLRRA